MESHQKGANRMKIYGGGGVGILLVAVVARVGVVAAVVVSCC